MRILLICGSLLGVALSLTTTEDRERNSRPSFRAYRKGPLRADDFHATPPAKPPKADGLHALAYTATDVRHKMRYRYTQRRRRFSAWLTSLQVDAVVLCDQSWNKQKQNCDLLDHEQGHFDITEIQTRRIQLHMRKLIKRGKALKVVATSKQDAVTKLQAQIRAELKPFVDASKRGHETYDELTRHGTRRQAQAEQRRKQKQSLKELQEALSPKRKRNQG